MGTPPILRDRLPEIRVPRHWRNLTSVKFPKPKLTAVQQDKVDRMVAWSSQSLEAEGEESNMGFLLRPEFLQKYLGYSEHRCAGMARVPDVLFGPKKKNRAGGSTRQTRSQDPNPALVKETEPSISSTEGSASFSLSGEESSEKGEPSPS
jgi:hypothetical protein